MKKNLFRKALIVFIVPAVFILSTISPANAGSAQGTMNVTASIVTVGGKCTFTVNPLIFPALTPTNPVDVFGSADIIVHCTRIPMTFNISADGGAYYSGGNRMQRTGDPSNHIHYNLTGTSDTVDVKKNPITVQVTGTILGTDYRTAYVGNYSDTVTLTLSY